MLCITKVVQKDFWNWFGIFERRTRSQIPILELPSQMENHYQLHVIDIIYPLEHPPPLYIISPESWLDGVGSEEIS